MAGSDIRASIQEAIQAFATTDLTAASIELWKTLGYRSDKRLDLPTDPTDFIETLGVSEAFHQVNARLDAWKSVRFLFQLTNDEIPSLAYGQMSLIAGETAYQKSMIESFVMLAVELDGQDWTRGKLAQITREMNRAFPMPVIVLFRHGTFISLAVINRRANLRDASKDVIDKSTITIIKDVAVASPHRAHLEILNDFALANVGERYTPSNFRDLYEGWMRVLSIQALNKRFYNELFTWYCWAIKETTFPKGQEQVSVAVIRLLTRLIFVWFVKEKKVVPDELFRSSILDTLLKEPPRTHPESSSFYQAILQNLFFATLNTELPERRWKSEGKRADGTTGMTSHYLIHSVYRYRSHFKDGRQADQVFDYFKHVPFLNGGLFECLDREVSARDLERTPDLKTKGLLEQEGKSQVLRVDGFSDRPKNPLSVPNKLFFAPGTRDGKTTDKGLIEIFSSYKFTIEENTPIEEEVALDPELLGKVFENLLASYNEETKATARKESGSFYTPREVVEYMVDESLLVYFYSFLSSSDTNGEKNIRLRKLLSFGNDGNEFSDAETNQLISAIDNLTVLDPACGSGAFPMGILQKLVYVLGKLDPDNSKWKAQNKTPLERQLKEAESIPDPMLRETKIEDAHEALDKLDRSFSDRHYADYSRKLFLIEKCLFGVDIQPIAVQIAKLRFFISLVVSQKINMEAVTDNYNVTPLPNLETKLVAANTLVPMYPQQGVLTDDRAYSKEDELKIANERYYAVRTIKTKRKWRDKIADIRDELASLLSDNPLFDKNSVRRVVEWNAFDQNASARFFDPGWMFGLQSGFDIVIGNPPYIKEYTYKAAFDDVRDSPYYQGKMDIWYLFACKAFDFLKKATGVLSFIATNNWVTNSGASKFRQVVAKRATIIKLVDFMDYKVFGSADIQTMILISENNNEKNAYTFDLRRIIDQNAKEIDMKRLLAGEKFTGLEYLTPNFDRTKLNDTTFTFSANQSEMLLERIEKVSRLYLDDKSEVAQGIVAPQDIVNNKSATVLAGNVKKGEGIFVLSGIEKQRLLLTDAEASIVKAFFTTDDLHRYFANKNNNFWVIYTDSKFKDTSAMTPYPNLKKHLDRFGSIITSDNAPYGLHRARANKFFVGEKIISLRKCSVPIFTFTDFDCYVSQTFNIIKTSRIDQRYLVAVFNSSIVRFWLRHRGKMQGNLYQVDKEPLMTIPLAKAQEAQNKVISNIVRALIATSDGHGYTTQTTILDNLLNGLVYEIYFPSDLHENGIHLFDQLIEVPLEQFRSLSASALKDAANRFADLIYKNDHPVYRMLFDLQALPLVRIIEGKE